MSVLQFATHVADFNQTTGPVMNMSPIDGQSVMSVVYGTFMQQDLNSLTDFWVSFEWGAARPAGAVNQYILSIKADDGEVIAALGNRDSSGASDSSVASHLSLYVNDTGTLALKQTSTNTVAPVGDVMHRIDVHVVLGVSGSVTVYHEGVALLTYSGDLSRHTSADAFIIASGYNVSSASYEHYFSRVFVADEDTRLMEILTAEPNAAGDLAVWTGAYTDIDQETELDDANVISTETTGNYSTFGKTAFDAAYNSGYNVVALGVSARAKGTGTLKPAVRTATNVNGDGVGQALTNSFKPVQELFATNPDTAAAWTFAEADAAQVGVKS